MSLELMLYASLAGLSFVFVLCAVPRESARIGNATGELAASQFVNSLNAELVKGAPGEFTLLVPQGLCNSTVSGAKLLYEGIGLYFVEPLSLSGRPLCPDGAPASFKLVYNGTATYLVRV